MSLLFIILMNLDRSNVHVYDIDLSSAWEMSFILQKSVPLLFLLRVYLMKFNAKTNYATDIIIRPHEKLKSIRE